MERLHVNTILPEQYKKTKNFEIKFGFIDSKFGPCIIGIHDQDLCYVAFYDEGKGSSTIQEMKNDWPNAILKEDKDAVEPLQEKIFGNEQSEPLNILLKGTDLQVSVWKELTKLKEGVTSSYESIAKAVGKPLAVRAVANAISKNKIAYIIPCHRVIQKSGKIGKYRWGIKCKTQMLKSESATE